ncbi:hypothetical protein BH23CHL5_BH23CHL5_10690 [soil metagenome]
MRCRHRGPHMVSGCGLSPWTQLSELQMRCPGYQPYEVGPLSGRPSTHHRHWSPLHLRASRRPCSSLSRESKACRPRPQHTSLFEQRIYRISMQTPLHGADAVGIGRFRRESIVSYFNPRAGQRSRQLQSDIIRRKMSKHSSNERSVRDIRQGVTSLPSLRFPVARC